MREAQPQDLYKRSKWKIAGDIRLHKKIIFMQWSLKLEGSCLGIVFIFYTLFIEGALSSARSLLISLYTLVPEDRLLIRLLASQCFSWHSCVSIPTMRLGRFPVSNWHLVHWEWQQLLLYAPLPLGVLIPEPFIDKRPFYLLFCPKSCWLLAAVLFHDPRSTIRVGHLGQHITILLLPSIHEVYQAVQRNGRNFCWGQVSNNLHQFHTISHDITQNFVCILFKNFINKIGIKIFKMISSWK